MMNQKEEGKLSSSSFDNQNYTLLMLIFSCGRIAAEVAHGLRLYFNKALGNNLLYRFERGQYGEQRKATGEDEPEMSRVYGAEHLLRLFGKCLNALPKLSYFFLVVF